MDFFPVTITGSLFYIITNFPIALFTNWLSVTGLQSVISIVPTVINPFMFIPTVILIPIVTNVFFYVGFASGIIPPLSGVQIPMQMPIVLFGLVQGNSLEKTLLNVSDMIRNVKDTANNVNVQAKNLLSVSKEMAASSENVGITFFAYIHFLRMMYCDIILYI